MISETSVAYIYFVCMLQYKYIYIYSIESTVHRLDLEHCKALEWQFLIFLVLDTFSGVIITRFD